MKYKEYLSIHDSFYNAIILQLSLACPLKCKHCSVFAGPRRTERLPTTLATSIIRDFGATSEAKLVVLTGGEPFAELDTLRACLSETTKNRKLASYVITAAPWATTAVKAIDVLRSLPPISLLTVSADVYHEEFVPLEYVRNAINAAVELDYDVLLSIAVDNSSTYYADTVRRRMGSLWDRIETDVLAVHPHGRAKGLDSASYWTNPAPLPEGACELLGTPVITANGAISACCQPESTNDAARKVSVYWIGDAYRDSIQTVKQRVDDDLLFQALRVWGPKELVRLLREELSIEVHLKDKYPTICALCRDLLRDASSVAALRSLLQSTNQISREIQLSRMLLYSEIRPCPATN